MAERWYDVSRVRWSSGEQDVDDLVFRAAVAFKTRCGARRFARRMAKDTRSEVMITERGGEWSFTASFPEVRARRWEGDVLEVALAPLMYAALILGFPASILGAMLGTLFEKFGGPPLSHYGQAYILGAAVLVPLFAFAAIWFGGWYAAVGIIGYVLVTCGGALSHEMKIARKIRGARG